MMRTDNLGESGVISRIRFGFMETPDVVRGFPG
jgi:hypothetical protein